MQNSKKNSTPALLPWIPPGKPKEESWNRYVHKKNSKQEFGEGSSGIWATDASKKMSVFSKKPSNAKMTNEDFLNSETNRDIIKNKILEIFQKDEEVKRSIEELKNDEADPEERNSDEKKSDSLNIIENEKASETTKKSRPPSRQDNSSKLRRNSIQEDTASKDELSSLTNLKYKTFRNEINRASSPLYRENVGGRVRNRIDRKINSVYDNSEYNRDRPDVEDDEGYFEPNYKGRYTPYFEESGATRDSVRFIDSRNTNGYFINQFDSHHPNPNLSLNQRSRGYPPQIIMTPLTHLNHHQKQPAVKANAWMVIPDKDGRSSRAVPVSFSGSVGSRLKQSFTNMSTLLNNIDKKHGTLSVSTSDTPIENLNYDGAPILKNNTESDRDKIFRCGAVILILCFVLTLGAIIAIIILSDQEASASAKLRRQSSIINNLSQGDECEQYSELSDSWRRISGLGPLESNGVYNCDLYRPGVSSKSIKQGLWYRFTGEAGTYIPTSAPSRIDGREVCGTSIHAWINGNHPLVNDGIVTREFCFQWTNGPCTFKIQSQIRTCNDVKSGGTFYVYKLMFPSDIQCNFAFCAME